MIENEGIELSGPPLRLLADYVADMTDSGELGDALRVVRQIVNQTIPALETALQVNGGAGDLTKEQRQQVYALRSLLDPEDDEPAKRAYQEYKRFCARGGMTASTYRTWYDQIIVPSPPPPTPRERVIAALEALVGQPVEAGLRLAWRHAETDAQREAVATMADALLKGVQDGA